MMIFQLETPASQEKPKCATEDSQEGDSLVATITESAAAVESTEGSVAPKSTKEQEPLDKPKFYKKDMLAILEEKNYWKEQSDMFQEELEEWKRYSVGHLKEEVRSLDQGRC